MDLIVLGLFVLGFVLPLTAGDTGCAAGALSGLSVGGKAMKPLRIWHAG